MKVTVHTEAYMTPIQFENYCKFISRALTPEQMLVFKRDGRLEITSTSNVPTEYSATTVYTREDG